MDGDGLEQAARRKMKYFNWDTTFLFYIQVAKLARYCCILVDRLMENVGEGLRSRKYQFHSQENKNGKF